MKSIVVLILLGIVMNRRRHSKRTRKEDTPSTTGSGCGSGVLASTQCNIEGVDYDKIKFCGCKYRGEDCKNYNFLVDPASTKPEVLNFYPQRPDKDGNYPDFVFVTLVEGEECYTSCGKLLLFKDSKIASAYVSAKLLDGKTDGGAGGDAAGGDAAKKRRRRRRLRKHH